MNHLSRLWSSEALDAEVVSGVSYGFALIFFTPLLLVAAGFLLYALFARRSVLRTARWLSIAWLLACIPASLLIVMGWAFNSSKLTPLITVPLWVVAGLLPLWLPVALRSVFGIRPV